MFLAIGNQVLIHDTNFNKITFCDWSKMFIMPKHVFYELFHATTMPNMIKEMTKNVFNNLMTNPINKND
jgi:hypothetical protein